MTKLRKALKGRRLVLDGAMGTEILRHRLSEADFRGTVFADHSTALLGNNDVLTLTRPDVISSIHEAYLAAGADIIETCTFNSQRISQHEYGTSDHVAEMNRAGVRLARRAADRYTALTPDQPRFVAGSVGPTSKMVSMGAVSFDELRQAYLEQMRVLVAEGVDAILIETIIDPLNAKAAIAAAQEAMNEEGRVVDIMLSLTVNDAGGHLLSGQTIEAFVAAVCHANLLSIGINCSAGANDILPHLRVLAACCPVAVSVHPNAGLPDQLGNYNDTPDMLVSMMKTYLDENLIDIIGGCCGTTPEHISAIRGLVDQYAHTSRRQPIMPAEGFCLSGLEVMAPAPGTFVNVGERCNVAGSRKFLRLISEGAHEEALEIARKQVDDGAMVLDINMDDGLLDAQAEMCRFVSMIGQDPAVARVPLMIDSSRFDVIEAALKCVQGKAVVNSLSLKEGEAVFEERARRVKALGAALVVMAFDEEGQATTYQRRIDVCSRAYRILTERVGFAPTDIIFDPNILTVATGMAEHADYAYDFVRATGWIRRNLPGAHVSGGVSNLSFAFRGNNYIREAMHAVFLYRAIREGMDMAIVNPATTVTYESIPKALREAIEAALFDERTPQSVERLTDLAAEYAGVKVAEAAAKDSSTVGADAPVGERLSASLVRGSSATLQAEIAEALEVYPSPLAIIEDPLMEGMNRVGDLFGQGKMFLPQVVKTARTMRAAVDILEPYLRSQGTTTADRRGRGVVLLATVKGDVHDIGKNIVGVILQCNGFTVRDLGVMVPPEQIVAEAARGDVDIVCLSGLITPSLGEMAVVVRMMEQAGLKVPVMVGGATTSALHTALKIAPEYPSGVVLHMADASQNPRAATHLLDPEKRDQYIADVKAEQERLRSEYTRRREAEPTDSEQRARQLRFRGDWCCYTPASPPFMGTRVRDLIGIDELRTCIDWTYFHHAWRTAADSDEGCRLRADAEALLDAWSRTPGFGVKAMQTFVDARQDPEDDAIIIGSHRLVTPRRRWKEGVRECPALCDYVSPRGETIGIFAATVSPALAAEIERIKGNGADSYEALLWHTVADRIVEAASEYMGRELAAQGWHGIRPAVGYPSLREQSAIFVLDAIAPLADVGISLTENGAMSPASAVAGIYISNPKARYL